MVAVAAFLLAGCSSQEIEGPPQSSADDSQQGSQQSDFDAGSSEEENDSNSDSKSTEGKKEIDSDEPEKSNSQEADQGSQNQERSEIVLDPNLGDEEDLVMEGESCESWLPPVVGKSDTESFSYLECEQGAWKVSDHLPELTSSGTPQVSSTRVRQLTQNFTSDRQVWLPVMEMIDWNRPSQADNSDSFEFIFSESIDQDSERIKKFTSALASYLNYWNPYLSSEDKIIYVLMDETDYDFYSETVMQLEYPNGTTQYWDSGRCSGGVNSENICGYGGPVDEQGNAIMYGILGSEADLENTLPPVYYAHKGVHAFQTTKYGPKRVLDWPCWISEGKAQLFQIGITQREWDMEADRKSVFGYAFSLREDFKSVSNVPDALKFINENEVDDAQCSQTAIGYSAGMLFNEKLIYDFGFDEYFSWLDEVKSVGSWRQAFVNSYGIEADYWYEVSFAPYMAEMVQAYQ